MSMRDLDLIHALTFDVAFDAMSAESAELADWVKADMLPVIEQVLDQHRGAGLRRIERLEIDLGTVSAVQARGELARRLFVQLSSALEESLAEAGAAGATGAVAQGPAADMLEFLRHGTVPWAAAWDANQAHTKLLRQVIDTPHAHAVLGVALGEAAMLTRLIRQFDTPALLAAAGALFHAWSETERGAALAWAAAELRDLQQTGGEAESFWRWFLPQYASPASPDLLLARWKRACRGEPDTEPLAQAPASAMAVAGFNAAALRTIEQGLERADAALLAPYWDRILAVAPQCLRDAHPTQWKLWLQEFDADTLADILGVVQADCAWLIACLATVVPRPRLNALLRPALAQWFAEPAGSLAPHVVLEWVKAAVPEQAARIRALFAAPDGGQASEPGKPAPASSAVRQPDEATRPGARDPAMPGPQATRASVSISDSAGLTPSEMEAIEHGLETADFALLAPYWDRILSRAPQCVRAAHPHSWERWLRNADDDTLADIVGVVQARCSWLIAALAAVLPSAGHRAQWRPALRQWLAAPIDSLAPQTMLDWVKAALPEQSDRFLALCAAQQSDTQSPSVAQVRAAASPQAQRDAAQAAPHLAAVASAGFTPSEMRAIEQGLATADFALLAPYWGRVLSSAPQWLRAVHPRQWQQWLDNFDEDVLTDILGVVQADCRDLIGRLATVVPPPRLGALLRPALQQWLGLPVDSLAPQTVLEWAALALPEQSGRILALFAAEKAEQALQSRENIGDEQLLSTAQVLFRSWPPATRDAALAWAGETLRRLGKAGSGKAVFWRWFLSQSDDPVELSVLAQQWLAEGGREKDASDTIAQGGPDEGGPGLAQRDPHAGARLIAQPDTAQLPAARTDVDLPDLLVDLAALDEVERGLRPTQASRTFEQLCSALDEPQVLARLARQLNAQQLLMAARILFKSWPDAQRDAVLAWGVDEQLRLHDAGADVASVWHWLLPRHAHPTTFDAVLRSYANDVEREAPATPGQTGALAGAAPVEQQEPAANRAADGRQAAVDSKHFREPLRVLGPIFARAEIITISKCLNAGQFQLLAPYWDRLLVLAPHWLRSEYPRLARTWLAGFDAEVLIDILSVVQAECCALIERLASVLPREQLHAALRPSLARWFDLGLDQLTPQAIMAQVLLSAPGKAAELLAMPGAPVRSAWPEAAGDAEPLSLEHLLERGDGAQWRRMWPAIVMSQRAQVRRHWERLSNQERNDAIARIATELSLAQRLDLALILQPAVAPLMAELLPILDARSERHDVLDTALQWLLHADVASAVPARLMRCLLERHRSLAAELPSGATRHVAAALQAIDPAPQVRAPEGQGAALASAHLSEAALRAYLDDCQRQEAPFGTLNSAQLHGLVQTWARFQQAGEASAVFLAAVEARALCAAAPHALFGKVLQQAMLGVAIDLDQIGAACGAALRAPFVLPIPGEAIVARHGGQQTSGALLDGAASPLAPLLRQALPQRLADAMLRADLAALDALWSDIVTHHPDLLRQAAQRYLGRAEAMKRLIGSTDSAKIRDLLGCLSAWTAQIVAPLLDSAARFSVMLSTPLAPDAFEQRVLHFALSQAMDQPSSTEPGAWISDLLRSVLPASSPPSEHSLVAHGWYELLRGEEAPLKAALEHALFGRAYLEVVRRRLGGDARDGLDTALPDPLQRMLTMELCYSHPALTDQLLIDGALADAHADVFSAAEWHALARTQLARQEPEVQSAFWREFAAHLPAPAANREGGEDEVKAAFCAAFGLLKAPSRQAGAAPSLERTPSNAAQPADTLAILLMRERAPDDAVKASITLLTQRLLADACADDAAYAALHSALSDHRAIDRLLAILPGPTLARLLCALQPQLACALPAVLRAISDSLPVTLSSVPATLDGEIWRAIFEVIFTGAVPASAGDLLGALVERLAGGHAPQGPAWQQQVDALSLAAAPGAAPVTPAAAMALLLQPLAGPPADKAAARAVRIDEAPLPFTGDANLRNAGLVIIAPYIERLFALLDITNDGVFISEATRQRGVHLLQYAISAEESTPEYLLALNKLLCGIPAAVPVVLGISMTEREKDTIEHMLKGVIAHWSAIGASSVEGLRETFLQREGCLYFQEEAWHLKIPQRTFDMLLDRLPWSYKLIKFSWMAAPLNVTWR